MANDNDAVEKKAGIRKKPGCTPLLRLSRRRLRHRIINAPFSTSMVGVPFSAPARWWWSF